MIFKRASLDSLIKKRWILLFFFSISFSASIGGYTSDVFNTSIMSRQAGMGGAGRTLASGAEAGFINSALLAIANNFEISYSNVALLAETNLTYIGLLFPLEDCSFSIGLISMQTSDIERHLNPSVPSAIPDGYFSALNQSLSIGVGKRFLDYLDLGLSAKYERRLLDTVQDSVFTADAGFMLNFSPMQFGGTLRNIYVKKYGNTEDDYPLDLDIGMNFSMYDRLLLCFDYIGLLTGHNRCYAGFEYSILKSNTLPKGIMFRCGINENEFSGGLGIMLGEFQIDYAYVVHELENQHNVSAKLVLGAE